MTITILDEREHNDRSGCASVKCTPLVKVSVSDDEE